MEFKHILLGLLLMTLISYSDQQLSVSCPPGSCFYYLREFMKRKKYSFQVVLGWFVVEFVAGLIGVEDAEYLAKHRDQL